MNKGSAAKRKKKLVAWRLSPEAVRTVESVAGKLDRDKTEIVEACIQRYAASLPEFQADAAAILVQAIIAGRLAWEEIESLSSGRPDAGTADTAIRTIRRRLARDARREGGERK